MGTLRHGLDVHERHLAAVPEVGVEGALHLDGLRLVADLGRSAAEP
jgi:hypothetical protein